MPAISRAPAMLELPPGVTLRVWRRQADASLAPFFDSGSKWLHPLFELAAFLAAHPEVPPAGLVLRDRVIGRAAAFLILRLGIRAASTELASERAHGLFAEHGLRLEADRTVERIDCRTEDLLADVHDVEAAWRLLDERRRLALARG